MPELQLAALAVGESESAMLGAKGVVLVSMQIRLAKGVGDGCGGCIC